MFNFYVFKLLHIITERSEFLNGGVALFYEIAQH